MNPLLAYARAQSRGYLDALHSKQRGFVEDKSERKAAKCGRRGGKSRALGIWHYEAALSDPGGLSVCVARSKGNARSILWSQGLAEANRKLCLGLELTEQDGQLYVLCPNGHRVWLAGCKDRGEIDKFRGFKFRRASIDEAQALDPILAELVEDVLSPALADVGGELALSGTPGPVPAGYFFEATTGGGDLTEAWSTHEWTVRDNPFFRTKLGGGELYLEQLLKKRGWKADHPTYRREWLGEWVTDLGALIYPYDANLNSFTELPTGDYTFALAVDLGASQDTPSSSFVVAAIRRGFPEIFVLEVEKRAGLIPSTVAAHVERFRRAYKLTYIVVDEGALGKGYAEEMRQTYNLPCEAAEKQKKRAYQELTGGDLKSGVIKLDPFKCRPLIDEMRVVQWNEERTEEDERFENHACDGLLYVTRKLRPQYRPQENPPKPGSVEAMRAEMAKNKREAQRKVIELRKPKLFRRAR